MEFTEDYILTGRNTSVDWPSQESHYRFTNQKDDDLWEDPSDSGIRLQQVSGPMTWEALTKKIINTEKKNNFLNEVK